MAMRLCIEILLVSAISVVAYYSFNKGNVDRSSLRGKRILITGGSQNIGEEVAYHYCKMGAKVMVTSRRQKILQSVAAKCLEFGAMTADFVAADMSNVTVYQSVIDAATEKLGGLDILVLNHVRAWNGPWNGTIEELDYVKKSFVINYVSYVGIATAATPHLKESKGQIIIVASQAGQPALPDFAAYGATKAAVINFFSSLQVEQIRYGVAHPTITICILGIVDTKDARIFAERSKIKAEKYPLSTTATEIVDGGLKKDRYVYIPWFLGVFRPLRPISPSIFDKILLLTMFG